VRAGGLLLVDLLQNGARALLASTSNGVFVTFLHAKSNATDVTRGVTDGAGVAAEASPVTWTRFGTCAEFPIVLNAGLRWDSRVGF
jgi:hypothetical protein